MNDFRKSELNTRFSSILFSSQRDDRGIFTVKSLQYPVHAMGRSLDEAVDNLIQKCKDYSD